MKSKYTIYIIIAGFALAAALFMAFLIFPSFKDMKQGSLEIAATKEKIALIELENKEIDSFKGKYEDYKVNLEKIEKMFVNPESPVDFIEFLEETALNSGIGELAITIVPPAQNKENPEVAISFKVSAKDNFLNLLKFAEKLETSPYVINVIHVTMKEQTVEEGGGLEAEFLIDAK